MIGRDHRGAAVDHEIGKQSQLGGEVVRDVGMIIHMIARQIGKAAGGDADAVEAKLIEPVRGRFQCQMGNAVARDLVELAMQRDRIGRGQRAVNGALRRHQSDGADAGRWMTQRLPDLPRERRDRGLAAGAGDGGDGPGLPRIKGRRRQRQRAARIGRVHERHADISGWWLIACDGRRAFRDRGIDEPRAVGLAARQREEQVARLDRAAVHGKAGDFDGLRRRTHRRLVAEQVAKSHELPVRPARPELQIDRDRGLRLTGLSSMPQE